MITIKKTFEVDTQGEEKKVFTPVTLTAFAIWLVEAINNKTVSPLYIDGKRFAWRSKVPAFAITEAQANGDVDRIYFSGQQKGMDFLHARELIDKIEDIAADSGDLLDDTYPGFTDHPNDSSRSRYQVTLFNDDKLLGYVDTARGKSILPVALKLNKELDGYELVETDLIVDRPWWDFN